jgi:ribosomal protein S12 methylthiotransferase accessory factor YcaO
LLDAMSEAAPAGAFEDIPSHETDDVLADVRWELESLCAAGMQTAIAVDLTRPEFGIPVVRMIVPGLEWDCTHPRYVPGRRALQAGERTA